MLLKSSLKTIIFYIFNFFSNLWIGNYAAILLYHSAADDGLYLTVKPELFERQMDYLKKRNYNVISLKHLVSLINKQAIIPSRTVVLTFDDGLLSHFENVFPILKKKNLPATFFVATGKIGGEINNSENKPLLTVNGDQLKELSGCELFDIEPHSVNHFEFDTLSSEETRKEMINSRKDLEDLLGLKCSFFAFPRGKFKKQDISLLHENGFEACVTTVPGLVQAQSNVFLLPRNTVDSSCVNDVHFLARLNWSFVLFRRIFGNK